jgi:esterase/lipase superfamily enzyme
LYYGGQRGDETPQLGICNVTIPPTHRLGEIETPFIASIPVLNRLSPRFEDPNKHVVIQGIAPLTRDDFLRHLRSRIAAAGSREAFVHIHGFNNSFADACRRTAQIAHDLKEFKGVPIMYSWASMGSPSPRAYLTDTGTVEWSVPHFERFLIMVASETGATTIHLVAHSMGSRLLAATLESLANKAAAPRQLGQLVFAAADVDAQTFKSRYLPVFKGVAKRTTSYVSSEDQALRLAQKAAVYPRVGEAGPNLLVVEGMDTIDASPVDTSLIGHDYLATKPVFLDLFELLAHGAAPQDRCGTPKCYFEVLASGGLRYWRFLKPE